MKKSSNLSASTRAFVSWFTVTRFKTTTLMFMICLGFMQCNTDESLESSKLSTDNPKITTRTCEPGSYAIINGRVAFDDDYEYVQTVEFLNCATPEDIDEWSREFELETVGKVYRDFIEIIQDDELTNQEFLDAKTSYAGKVLFSVTGDGEVVVAPLYPVLEEFCNLDGEFQVGDAVVKLTENKMISITDPITIDPSTVDDNTVTDTTDGLFVNDLRAASLGGGCCPSADENEETFTGGPGTKRRLWENYGIYNGTFIVKYSGGRYIVNPMILVKTDSKCQNRRGIFPVYWYTPNFHYTSFEMDMSFTHNYSSWMTSPVHLDFAVGSEYNWGWQSTARISTRQILFALYRPPSTLTVCVSDVYELFTNDDLSESVEIDCD